MTIAVALATSSRWSSTALAVGFQQGDVDSHHCGQWY